LNLAGDSGAMCALCRERLFETMDWV
jgi:hypothetical protein